MATVHFYQKPGCATNARQKRMLEAAGHTVVAASLLTEPWTPERLLPFFAGTPVAAWFNRAAPRVKSGAIDPERIEASAALALMVAEPLLIRRPLIDADGQKCAGFDREPVTSLLAAAGEAQGAVGSDRESCSRSTASRAACPDLSAGEKTRRP